MIYRRWPVRSLLTAYVETVLKPQALHRHEHNTLLWRIGSAFGGSKDRPPAVPDILKGE